ncbi:hypothetical protein DB88DRAFT_539985 [Papiliotrema laurentii]|uniref:Uncharacterized protein n=1 Tax=Papiliotrema laurentii TaxID=5418 RepID=A0AAD9L6A9_PAPLA|nr:hypothetical protein DB88DRAFT_539985 [Papiliotrema laurentii]
MSRRSNPRVTVKVHLPMLIGVGLSAGAIGVAVMTFGEKIEQAFTKRPNSEVPGLTLARLLGRLDSDKGKLNWPMHYGQGAILGVLRATLSVYGLRGPFIDFIFAGIRLLNDQTLENWTGAGALPWTWPVEEQVLDIAHKLVFATATGWVCDWWLR